MCNTITLSDFVDLVKWVEITPQALQEFAHLCRNTDIIKGLALEDIYEGMDSEYLETIWLEFESRLEEALNG